MQRSERLIYLASPYSHPDPWVREERYQAVLFAAAKLMNAGEIVFCPIAHSHAIGKQLGRIVDHDFWLRQDQAILEHASKMVVLTLAGWNLSKGVAAEMRFAEERGIPIQYLAPGHPS